MKTNLSNATEGVWYSFQHLSDIQSFGLGIQISYLKYFIILSVYFVIISSQFQTIVPFSNSHSHFLLSQQIILKIILFETSKLYLPGALTLLTQESIFWTLVPEF